LRHTNKQKEETPMSFEVIDIKTNKSVQSVKIPQKMRLDDKKVFIRKLGNALYIIPFSNPWGSLIEGVDSFTSDFMLSRDEPASQTRESL
jgi:antitoxin VapB